MKTILCREKELQEFAFRALRAVGTSEEDAHYVAKQIVGSEIAGHESHGLRRLSEYVQRAQDGHADPVAKISIERDSGSLVKINGNSGFGHLVFRDVTTLLIERSQNFGIAAIGVRNSEYAGRFYDFSEMAAEQGVITLFFANASGGGQVAGAPGSLEKRLSTNPISFGFPRKSSPHFVLDMALTTVAMGRVSEWKDRGEEIPTSWANDEGVLQFFGGFKGFGLALMVEALAGALTGAGVVRAGEVEEKQGVFVIGIDVSHFRKFQDFEKDIEDFISYIKEVPLAPGFDPIRIPGESTHLTAENRKAEGIPLQAFTWEKLCEIASDLTIEPPQKMKEH